MPFDPREHGCLCDQCVLGPRGPIYSILTWRPVGPEIRRGVLVTIVGEAPGPREVEARGPFKGESGRMLEQALGQLDPPQRRSDCMITNAACCRPPKNDMKAVEALAKKLGRPSPVACCNAGGRVFKEIKKSGCEVVIPVGNTALQLVARKRGIAKFRGAPMVVDLTASFKALKDDTAAAATKIARKAAKEAQVAAEPRPAAPLEALEESKPARAVRVLRPAGVAS